MSIATISKPSSGPVRKPRPGIGSRLSAASRDNTMATMFMTQLPDARLQHQFHRLMVVGKNSKVLNTYPLKRQITSVGRSRQNDVCVDDAQVSAKHLIISIANKACVVNDLGSSNGTFINGQRLSGFQVLSDGDEIMIGKTILQFAARRKAVPGTADAAHRRPFVNKKWFISAAAMCCLTVAFAFVSQVDSGGLKRFATMALMPFEKNSQTVQPASPQLTTTPQSPAAAANTSALQHAAQDRQNALIQQALADYATGRINSAKETFRILIATGPQTPAVAQARQMLSMLNEIQQIHAQALEAQV
jgi:hypothetical protein